MVKVEKEPTENLPQNVDSEAVPNWIVVQLYRFYSSLIETDIFLEKWGVEEIYEKMLVKLDEIEEKETEKKKKNKKHKTNKSSSFVIDAQQAKHSHLLNYPHFKSSKYFNFVAPRLLELVNRKLSSRPELANIEIDQIVKKKQKITVMFSRKK